MFEIAGIIKTKGIRRRRLRKQDPGLNSSHLCHLIFIFRVKFTMDKSKLNWGLMLGMFPIDGVLDLGVLT
jgi:hypothetical protein